MADIETSRKVLIVDKLSHALGKWNAVEKEVRIGQLQLQPEGFEVWPQLGITSVIHRAELYAKVGHAPHP